MTLVDLAKKILRILDPGQPIPHTFYSGDPPKFSHEHVELLLKLESRLDQAIIKDSFWMVLGTALLFPRVRPSDWFGPLPGARISNLAKKNADVCIMAYFRANRTDKALDGLIGRASDKKDFNLYPSASVHCTILSCINEVLVNENWLFNDNQLDKLEKYFDFCESALAELRIPTFITTAVSYINPEHRKIISSVPQYLGIASDNLKRTLYKRTKEELDFVNIEINRDKELVKDEIDRWGFSKELKECLEQFEQGYNKASSDFNYKETIGHIRSFMDELAKEIAKKVQHISGETPSEPLDKFGRCRSYFRQNKVDFLNKEEDELLGGIYGVMSNKGVHSLKSPKEYARLAKNMAIECALFLFRRLDKYSMGT